MALVTASREGAAKSPPSTWRLALFAVIVLLAYIGAALLLAAGLHTRSLGLPVAGGVRTSGVVVNESVSHEKSYAYRPVIEFVDIRGQRIEFAGAWRSSRAGVGNPVSVSYNPSHPADAHDLAANSTWLFQFGAGLVSLFVALGCTRLIWQVRRHGPIGAQVPTEPAAPFG